MKTYRVPQSGRSVLGKISRTLAETYSEPNSYLLRYLKGKSIRLYDNLVLFFGTQEFENALANLGLSPDAILKRFGVADVFELTEADGFLDFIHALEDQISEEDREELAQLLVQEDPTEAPSWAFFTLNGQQLLKPSTWLVHYTDDAIGIATRGFKFGEPDVTKLGLTRYKSQRFRKDSPGYNFAYQLPTDERKYGDECVVFQSAGVGVYHSGDEEDQVVFWGPGITTAPVAITEDSDGLFVVHGKGDQVLARLRTKVLAQKWVVFNYEQYRRYL